MAILILAEHDNAQLKSSTLSTLTAALAIGAGDIDILVAGKGAGAVAEAAAKLPTVRTVLHADDSAYGDFTAESLALLLVEHAKNYSHILAPATTFGKDVMPRVAALLDSQQISDITAVLAPDTFKRPIYAGNAIATVQSSDPVKVITVRVSAFRAAAATGGNAEIRAIASTPSFAGTRQTYKQETVSERPELTSARIVISGGRGLGSKEHFALLEGIATKLGAAIGASRAAVDAGYVSNDYQVGQTGKIIAPDLYIAVGISGAIQHLAGMKESRVIVAINKDENAPIFEIADYGLVADLFEVLPELEKAL